METRREVASQMYLPRVSGVGVAWGDAGGDGVRRERLGMGGLGGGCR